MDQLCPAAPPDAPRFTLGSILRQFLPALESTLGLRARARRLLWRLASCRTGELGVTIFQCTHCHKSIGPPVPAGTAIAHDAWPAGAGSGSISSSAAFCPLLIITASS